MFWKVKHLCTCIRRNNKKILQFIYVGLNTHGGSLAPAYRISFRAAEHNIRAPSSATVRFRTGTEHRAVLISGSISVESSWELDLSLRLHESSSVLFRTQDMHAFRHDGNTVVSYKTTSTKLNPSCKEGLSEPNESSRAKPHSKVWYFKGSWFNRISSVTQSINTAR